MGFLKNIAGKVKKWWQGLKPEPKFQAPTGPNVVQAAQYETGPPKTAVETLKTVVDPITKTMQENPPKGDSPFKLNFGPQKKPQPPRYLPEPNNSADLMSWQIRNEGATSGATVGGPQMGGGGGGPMPPPTQFMGNQPFSWDAVIQDLSQREGIAPEVAAKIIERIQERLNTPESQAAMGMIAPLGTIGKAQGAAVATEQAVKQAAINRKIFAKLDEIGNALLRGDKLPPMTESAAGGKILSSTLRETIDPKTGKVSTKIVNTYTTKLQMSAWQKLTAGLKSPGAVVGLAFMGAGLVGTVASMYAMGRIMKPNTEGDMAQGIGVAMSTLKDDPIAMQHMEEILQDTRITIDEAGPLTDANWPGAEVEKTKKLLEIAQEMIDSQRRETAKENASPLYAGAKDVSFQYAGGNKFIPTEQNISTFLQSLNPEQGSEVRQLQIEQFLDRIALDQLSPEGRQMLEQGLQMSLPGGAMKDQGGGGAIDYEEVGRRRQEKRDFDVAAREEDQQDWADYKAGQRALDIEHTKELQRLWEEYRKKKQGGEIRPGVTFAKWGQGRSSFSWGFLKTDNELFGE